MLAWTTTLVYTLILVAVLARLARHRERASLPVVGYFGAIGGAIGLSAWDRLGGPGTTAALALLTALPYLRLCLLDQFVAISPFERRLGVAGLALPALLLLLAAEPSAAANAAVAVVVVGLVGAEPAAVVACVGAARAAGGTSRHRCLAILIGALLFDLAAYVPLIAVPLVAAPSAREPAYRIATIAASLLAGVGATTTAGPGTQLLALGSSLCHLAAFLPPSWLLAGWQMSELRGFLASLVRPPQHRLSSAVDDLGSAAARAVGGLVGLIAIGEGSRPSLRVRAAAEERRWVEASGVAAAGLDLDAPLLARAWGGLEAVGSVDPAEWGLGLRRLAECCGGARSAWVAPLRSYRGPIGLMVVLTRRGPLFAEADLDLLRLIGDQAAIAVENARLFREVDDSNASLREALERLRATFEVAQAVSGTLDLDQVLQTVVSRASDLAGADGGAVYVYDPAGGVFDLRATHRMSEQFVTAIRQARIRMGETVVGRAGADRAPVQLADVQAEEADPVTRAVLERAGYRAVLAVPLLRETAVVGTLVVRRKTPGAFAPDTVALLQTFATQSALAVQNARLFAEIEQKSLQLEEASRHKSEFLANMSHELRTPLNAVIGFTEVLLERYFGEINAKQEEYLGDVLSSGQHLLSLINDILDLSKVEAGRMELELSTFDLDEALQAGLVMVKERASRKGIELSLAVAADTGRVEADERKVKQVLFNLLTNAVKFTPEGGTVSVAARRRDGQMEIAVADTGVGIAAEEQGRVFEEFGQARSAAGQSEGTGLGLALCKRFVELHGGTIAVASAVGRGSTFTFSLPVRQAEPVAPQPGGP